VPTVRVNDIDIWYRLEGNGPVLVLNHGFAGPTDGWPPVVDELRPYYTLLQWDMRAHGRTTVPDAATVTIPQFAADLAGLLEALDIERPHVAGVSMGGMVSAQFACDYPERLRSLWLCDTAAGNGGDPATAHREQQLIDIFIRQEQIVENYGLKELVARENRYRHEGDAHASKSFFTLEEQDERNAKKLERMTAAGYLAASRALRTRPDLTSRTPKIAVPTMVSCGEWDMFYPCAQRDARLIPNARFATVRFAAHDSTNYRPRSWLRAGLEFYADVETGRDVAGEVEYTD
jgi:3-oxoadipate enol-lactonase